MLPLLPAEPLAEILGENGTGYLRWKRRLLKPLSVNSRRKLLIEGRELNLRMDRGNDLDCGAGRGEAQQGVKTAFNGRIHGLENIKV